MIQGFPDDVAQAQQYFSRVLWLGGGTDAGKSSVVQALGEKYSFRWYNFDYFEPSHFQRMNREAHPSTFAFLAMTMDERWVYHSAKALAQLTIEMWRERFNLVLEDLRDWPRDGLIVAEGPGLFPECVAPYIRSINQALWMVPSSAFKRKIHPTRENKLATAAATSDPSQALTNQIARDLLIAEYIEKQARARADCSGSGWVKIDPRDGSRSRAALWPTHGAGTVAIIWPRCGTRLVGRLRRDRRHAYTDPACVVERSPHYRI
jgi:hypothetical protein